MAEEYPDTGPLPDVLSSPSAEIGNPPEGPSAWMKKLTEFLSNRRMADVFGGGAAEPGSPPNIQRQPPANMLDAELRAGAPPRMPAQPVAQRSALPAPQMRQRPGGALTPTGAPQEMGPARPMSPSLDERYRAGMANIPGASPSLTPEQKAKLGLDFGLRLMANSSKRGASFSEALGNAGLGTSAEHGKEMDIARGTAEKRRGEAREDVFRETGFGEKSEDNRRADRQLSIMEKHYGAQDKRDAERIALLREQVGQGRVEVKFAPNGQLVVWDKKSGKMDIFKDKDGKPYVMGEKGGITAANMLDTASKMYSSDLSSNRTPEGAADEARRLITALSGQAQSNGIARPQTEAEFAALPKGARYINPKDGKPYTKN